MQKKSTSELANLKESDNVNSQVHSGEDCITFISLSHYEMHKLVHDQQNFVNKVKSINNQAKKKIDLGAYKQALALLSEGQKILEYAAGSGKTIERELIICVLHNIASANHKLWMLQKCLSYVQGLIFNLQNHLTSLQNSVVSTNQKQELVVAMQSFQMKHMLTTYNIRFCALNSQQYNHKQALASAKKALTYIRSILTFDEQYIRNLFRKEKQPQNRIQLKYRLLMEIIQFQNNLNLKKHKQILKAAHFSLQIWNKNKEKPNNYNYPFLKNYSIGDFMDLKAKQYHFKKDKLSPQEQRDKQFQASIVYKLILLSISYFSVSTELRLVNSDTQYYSQIQKQNGATQKESQIYHLLAITVFGAILPIDILYLKHVINSYTNYFNSGIVDYKTVEPESLEKVIQLISDNKLESPLPGSTEIISSESMLPEMGENNQYRLKDRLFQKNKNQRKNLHKMKKKTQRTDSKRNYSKNFSSLENKSIIKDDKNGLKTLKVVSKEKSKTKPKSKSKTLQKTQKKSKQKQGYFFVKTSSKSKKKLPYQDIYTLSKKVSPKKSKQHINMKEMGSQIIYKSQKKSILNQKTSIAKKLLTETRSPKRRNNIYGLHY